MICGGATCARKRSGLPEFNPPPVFTAGTPTLEDVIAQTNRSLSVNALSSNSLTISSPDIAYKLSGNFRWERPDRFRLDTKLFSSAMGVPLAAGSNADLFWLQTSRPTPTIYYARHNEFDNQQGGRHVLPVSPLWLREAFGIVELDPQGQHEGPTTRPDGKLEVVSYIPSARGSYQRVLVIAPTTGTIEETRLYDQSGKMIAIARMMQHQYYSGINWSLPHQVQIQLIPDVGDAISFTVDVGYYQTNETSPGKIYEFPDTTGISTVDLVRINAASQPQSSMQQYTAQQEQYGAGQGSVNNGGANSGNTGYAPEQLPWTVQQAPYGSPAQPPSGLPVGTPNGSQFNGATPNGTMPNGAAGSLPGSGVTDQPTALYSPGVTAPVYRTSAQPASTQGWQGNLRR